MRKTWNDFLQHEQQQEYYKNLQAFLENAYATSVVYPKKEDIFNAFSACKLEDIKVVILGQDPYHEENQAHGFAFSVPEGVKIPPSLVNICKEIKREYGYEMPSSGNLEGLAKQGVFLLNTTLTVEQGKARSHYNKGWEVFSDHAISFIDENNDYVVFMLWGNDAKKKKKLLKNPKNFVLMTSHPSPLSVYRGFDGCNHFKDANAFLKEHNKKEIDWNLSECK